MSAMHLRAVSGLAVLVSLLSVAAVRAPAQAQMPSPVQQFVMYAFQLDRVEDTPSTFTQALQTVVDQCHGRMSGDGGSPGTEEKRCKTASAALDGITKEKKGMPAFARTRLAPAVAALYVGIHQILIADDEAEVGKPDQRDVGSLVDAFTLLDAMRQTEGGAWSENFKESARDIIMLIGYNAEQACSASPGHRFIATRKCKAVAKEAALFVFGSDAPSFIKNHALSDVSSQIIRSAGSLIASQTLQGARQMDAVSGSVAQNFARQNTQLWALGKSGMDGIRHMNDKATDLIAGTQCETPRTAYQQAFPYSCYTP